MGAALRIFSSVGSADPHGYHKMFWFKCPAYFGRRTYFDAKVSPNGRWLAYSSNESKRNEIFVQTFPEHKGKWQISTNGGRFPLWSRDGSELYFISAGRKLMAVKVKGDGNGFEGEIPTPLFEIGDEMQFDVSKDGRFLIQVPVDDGQTSVPLTVVTNWQTELKK
jgi:hypothetical protein